MFGRLALFKRKEAAGNKIELEEHRYCPSCGDEYRAEIEFCVTCNIALISAEQKQALARALASARAGRTLQISPDDELVAVRKGTLRELKDLQRLLEKELIASLLVGDGPDCTRSCCGSAAFTMQVKAAEAREAAEILDREYRRTTGLDSHEFSAHEGLVLDQRSASCPACGERCAAEGPRTCPGCGLCF